MCCASRDQASATETSRGRVRATYVLACPGREGAHWFREKAWSLGVQPEYGAIDIGCRVEVASPVYEEITGVLYDPKFVFVTPTYQDHTRTFCTNPGGRVLPNLFVAGDGAGKSRGIVGAAVNGLMAAEGILLAAAA